MVNPHPHTLTLSHSPSHTLTITLTLSHPHIVTLTLSHPHTTSREPSSVSAKPAPEEMQGSLEDTGVTQLNPIKVDIKYVLYNTPLYPHTIPSHSPPQPSHPHRSLEATAEDSAIFKKTKNLIKDNSSHSHSEVWS